MNAGTRTALLVLAALPLTAPLYAQDAPPITRIGTFDSRAVALAYYRSPDGLPRLIAEWDEKLADARAAGDSARVEELELMKPSMQHLMHQQVFSNGAIPNVMREIRDDLPAIAVEADVALIVSKWELCYSESAAEVVDVTPMILALFEIDEQTQGYLDQMAASEPIPLDELPYDPAH